MRSFAKIISKSLPFTDVDKSCSSQFLTSLICPLKLFMKLKKYREDIQMFLLNMSFISRVKWTIFIFHEWQSHE